MSEMLEHMEQTPLPAIQAPLFDGSPVRDNAPGTHGTLKVVIKGDIRLRVPERYAALRSVKGCYRIEMEGMQEPLHVLWMSEGTVLTHTVHCIEVAFDVRGTPAGETLTRQLTAQVVDKGGQGSIMHSSVFVQIFVVKDELPCEETAACGILFR